MDTKKIRFIDVIKFHLNIFKRDNEMFLIWIFLGNMVVAGIAPLLPIISPKFIIDAISNNDLDLLIQVIVLFGVISLIVSILVIKFDSITSGRFLASRVRQNRIYMEKFKDVSFYHLENNEFHKKRSEALNTLSSNNDGYQGTLQTIFKQMAELFSILCMIFILGIFNPWIIVVAIVVGLIQFKLAMIGKKNSMSKFPEYTDRDRKVEYFYKVAHDFSYGKDIRINQLQKPLIKRYKEKHAFTHKLFKEIKIFEYKMTVFDTIFLLITNGFTYYLVVNAYFNGTITLGTVAMTIMTVLAITVKLQNTFKALAKLKEDMERTKKYMVFMEEEYFNDNKNGKTIDYKNLSIEFENVSFKYPMSEDYVLNNVSFKMNPGQKLALVGINGSGKTTIVKLISGFYLPTKGDIFINGVSTRDLDLTVLRNHIAVVFQDVNIYAASVLENITGLSPNQEKHDRAIHALSEVGLLEKVNQYPNKENQSLLKVVDNEGTDLSGGEAQKLSISRALYKENTELIILDEPTSALDAIAEKEIYENFNTLVNNRTAIMISHRLASTRFCDDIIFLENGEIIESGTHDELMSKETGKYQEMFTLQGKYYKEGSETDEV